MKRKKRIREKLKRPHLLYCPFCREMWVSRSTEGAVTDPHGTKRMTCQKCVISGYLQPTGVHPRESLNVKRSNQARTDYQES